MLQARFHDALDEIPRAAWNALLPDDNPFVDYDFLAGLERTDCVEPTGGWQPHHLGLWDGDRLRAAAPLYFKGNSHGEFVFDWSWARAWAERGLDYYPKLLCGVPYSPVSGPRLLCGSSADVGELKCELLRAMVAETERLELSSVHLNFADAADTIAFAGSGWLARSDWQYHWHNRGWKDFDAFLAALSHKKRKNIRRERERVHERGVACQIKTGEELDDADWSALHRFYLATFEDKGNWPSLSEAFFHHLGQAMPQRVVAVLCRRGGRPMAGALMLRSRDTLYGRYWGALEHVEDLHFEACYYQGIEYCLRQGIARFEPGAGGEHKLARGFLPARTRSFHWIADPRFREAIARALQREERLLAAYAAELRVHSPYAERP